VISGCAPRDPVRTVGLVIASVRRLGPDEWTTWRDARIAALTDAPEAFGSSLEREAAYDEGRWRAWMDPARGLKAVVIANLSTVAGAIGAWVPEERNGAVELYSMWVSPSWRGRGVGDALIAEALAWSREQGRERVDLWVVGGNAAARRLYERHGFSVTDETQPHPRDPSVIECVMTIDLTARRP
jgi:ribosomal protein S18 acetylase RimI-like enzyme